MNQSNQPQIEEEEKHTGGTPTINTRSCRPLFFKPFKQRLPACLPIVRSVAGWMLLLLLLLHLLFAAPFPLVRY